MTTACGTARGYHQHYRKKEPACRACLTAHNARNREYRKHGTIKIRELAPHGTDAAYHRHISHGTIACRSCKDAHALYLRKRCGSQKTGPVRAHNKQLVKIPIEVFAALWFTASTETLEHLDRTVGAERVDAWIQEAEV